MVDTTETDDVRLAEKAHEAHQTILAELGRVVVGQQQVIEELLITIFARGHCLLVGVPGLAKTLLVSTLAKSMDLDFKRIQFTPDLMPSDITGTEVIQDDPDTGERKFKFLKGPIFANVILADEINRTPPKTQSALLEAMQERRVSVGGTDYELEEPFFVLATQNPIEQEGTYPLPEAQLDRFMFMVHVDYPSDSEESEIIRRTTAAPMKEPESIIHGSDIVEYQELVRRVPAADTMIEYAKRIARSTRTTGDNIPEFIKKWVTWGAGPRASMFMILAAKARALLHGEAHVSWEHIRAVAKPILRHRIILNFAAQAEGMTTDQIVDQVLEHVPEK
jgi:MoxR-like ATPase